MTTILRRLFLVATPLALAIALWWHPAGGSDIYADVRDDVDAWLFVHTAFLFFTPLLGIAAYMLLRGLESRAATVSRVALVFFLVFYTAYEVTVGVGTAILVDYANGLPAAEQAAVAGAIQDYNENCDPLRPVRLILPRRLRLDRCDGGRRRRLPSRRGRLAHDAARRLLRAVCRPPAAGRPGRPRLLRRGRRTDRTCAGTRTRAQSPFRTASRPGARTDTELTSRQTQERR